MRSLVALGAVVALLGVVMWGSGSVERSGVEDLAPTSTTVRPPLEAEPPASLGEMLDAAGEVVQLNDVMIKGESLIGTVRTILVGSDPLIGSRLEVEVPLAWTSVDPTLSTVWVLLDEPLDGAEPALQGLAVLGLRGGGGTLEVLVPSVDVPITALDPNTAPLSVVESWVRENGEPSPHVPTDLQNRYRLARASAEAATP